MFSDYAVSGLLSAWPRIRFVPYKYSHTIRVKKEDIPAAQKDDDIFDFLHFIKAIPAHGHGFAKAVRAFLVYSCVSIVSSCPLVLLLICPLFSMKYCHRIHWLLKWISATRVLNTHTLLRSTTFVKINWNSTLITKNSFSR